MEHSEDVSNNVVVSNDDLTYIPPSDQTHLAKCVNILTKIVDERARELYGKFETSTPGSAGFDLRAMFEGEVTLSPGETILISTGISIWIKDPNLVGMVYPRSGLGGKREVVLGNLTGVIDSDYQGELMLFLWNRGNTSRTIKHGDRVAQLVIQPCFTPIFDIVEDFDNITDRADGGMGSTGDS